MPWTDHPLLPLPANHYQAEELVTFRQVVSVLGVKAAIAGIHSYGENPLSAWAQLRQHVFEEVLVESCSEDDIEAVLSLRTSREPPESVLETAILAASRGRVSLAWILKLAEVAPGLARDLAGKGDWLFAVFKDSDDGFPLRTAQQATWGPLWKAAWARWTQPGALTKLHTGSTTEREQEALGLAMVATLGISHGRALAWNTRPLKALVRHVGPVLLHAQNPAGAPFLNDMRADIRRRVLEQHVQTVGHRRDNGVTQDEAKVRAL